MPEDYRVHTDFFGNRVAYVAIHEPLARSGVVVMALGILFLRSKPAECREALRLREASAQRCRL